MSETFEITREIQLDAGHRVPDHASKCRNVHGHRYVVQVTLVGELKDEGEEAGMVMDFGFLKDDMMKAIHDPYDHTLIMYKRDPLLLQFLEKFGVKKEIPHISDGKYQMASIEGLRLIIIPVIPTAENLAKHWFDALIWDSSIGDKPDGMLQSIKIWETPNCMAEYRRPK